MRRDLTLLRALTHGESGRPIPPTRHRESGRPIPPTPHTHAVIRKKDNHAEMLRDLKEAQEKAKDLERENQDLQHELATRVERNNFSLAGDSEDEVSMHPDEETTPLPLPQVCRCPPM